MSLIWSLEVLFGRASSLFFFLPSPFFTMPSLLRIQLSETQPAAAAAAAAGKRKHDTSDTLAEAVVSAPVQENPSAPKSTTETAVPAKAPTKEAGAKKAKKSQVNGTAKIPKKKDPNAPKHPQTAYNHYQDYLHPLLQQDNSDLTWSECSKISGPRWRQLSKDEKRPYKEMYDENKRVYDVQLREYERKVAAAAAANGHIGTTVVKARDAVSLKVDTQVVKSNDATSKKNRCEGHESIGNGICLSKNTVFVKSDETVESTSNVATGVDEQRKLAEVNILFGLQKKYPATKVKKEKVASQTEPRRVTSDSIRSDAILRDLMTLRVDNAKPAENQCGAKVMNDEVVDSDDDSINDIWNAGLTYGKVQAKPDEVGSIFVADAQNDKVRMAVAGVLDGKEVAAPAGLDCHDNFHDGAEGMDPFANLDKTPSQNFNEMPDDDSIGSKPLLSSSKAEYHQTVNGDKEEAVTPLSPQKPRQICKEAEKMIRCENDDKENTSPMVASPNAKLSNTPIQDEKQVVFKLVPLTPNHCRTLLKRKDPNFVNVLQVPDNQDICNRKTIALSWGNELDLARNSTTGIKSSLISRKLCTVTCSSAGDEEPTASVLVCKPPKSHAVYVDGQIIGESQKAVLRNKSIVSLYGALGYAYEFHLNM
jgi:hypothetical protein